MCKGTRNILTLDTHTVHCERDKLKKLEKWMKWVEEREKIKEENFLEATVKTAPSTSVLIQQRLERVEIDIFFISYIHSCVYD